MICISFYTTFIFSLHFISIQYQFTFILLWFCLDLFAICISTSRCVCFDLTAIYSSFHLNTTHVALISSPTIINHHQQQSSSNSGYLSCFSLHFIGKSSLTSANIAEIIIITNFSIITHISSKSSQIIIKIINICTIFH